jgi:uroporphyrin-III C-methyltransferase
MIENYPTPQPGASLLLSFNPSKRSESRNTILFLSPNKLTSTRSFAALEAGYKVLIGSHIDDQQWDEELVYRKRLGQVGEIEWNLSEKADKEDWENWLDGLGTPLRKEILLIVLNDTIPFGGSAPPATPPGSAFASLAPSPSTIERKRRTFASAVAFQQVASDWNFLVNVADAPTLSDFTWPITHRFTLSTQPSATPSTTHSTLYDSKSPLQMALTTNSSVCRLTSRIKREIVAALPETIGSAVLAISNLRSDLIHKADEESKAIQEREEEEGWDDDDDDDEASLNQPVRQLTSQQAEALDQVQLGGGRSRGKSELEIVEERALSPCRARAISRSRSRSTGGRSDIRSS